MNTLFIGIAGGTGSGKTTLTEHLAKRFGPDISVVHHDNYYKRQNCSFEERCLQNYDHPDAFDTDLMIEDLKKLKAGQTIHCPVYDYGIHNRTDKTVEVRPTKVVIIEGILIFQNPDLRDLLDIKIFVETDADVRILRRALRDVEERGRFHAVDCDAVSHDRQAHARAVRRADAQVRRHRRARGRQQSGGARSHHAADRPPHRPELMRARLPAKLGAAVCLLLCAWFLAPLGMGIVHIGMLWPSALLVLAAARLLRPDVFRPEDAVRILQFTGADAAMIGRGCFGNPWLFQQAQAALDGEEIPPLPPLRERAALAVRQIELAVADKGEHIAILEARKQYAWYLKGVPHANYYKEQIVRMNTLEDVYRVTKGIQRDLT